jgi:LysR family transcriptional regulator, positive regulator for ilvC
MPSFYAEASRCGKRNLRNASFRRTECTVDGHRDLRLFLHLTGTLNFGRTSDECHVSPATLTRAIQRLETQAGERLLDRGPRGVSVTDAGRRFTGYARDSLRLWDEYRTGTVHDVPLSGRLSLFASVTACEALLPDLLAGFRADHPAVEIDLRTGDAAAAISHVDDGTVDVAIAALPPRIPEHLATKQVATTPLVFVTARDRYREITGAPLVLPRHGLARAAADRWLRRRGLTAPRVSEVDGHEPLLALVALGCGVGVVPQLVLDSSPLTDRLATLPARPSLGRFHIGLCTRRTDLRRPLTAALWSSVTANPQKAPVPFGVPRPVGPSYPDLAVHR